MTDVERIPDPASRMSEEDLLRAVVDLAQLLGILVHHSRPALTGKGWRTAIVGDKGLPDLILVGARGVLYRELKADKGRVRPEQHDWLTRLEQAGQDAAVWRPGAWPTQIRTELEAIR